MSAAAAIPLTQLAAAAGQGVGTLLAGGAWIGLCLPFDRQAWALVNQPALNFAALPAGSGYWLGSLLAPVLIAALALPFSLRVATLIGQLAVVQLAWTSAVVGVAWQPSLLPELSHLARWLHFRGLPPELRFVTVVVAVAVVVPVVLRLLALARITRFHLGRGGRLAVVTVHMLPLPILWCGISAWLTGNLPVEACLVTAAPLLTAMVVAWFGYPAPMTHAVSGVRWNQTVVPAVALTLALALIWFAGRPLPDNTTAALQWARSTSMNNIRGWMTPSRAPWLPDAPR